MNKNQYALIDRITNNSIVFIALLGIPINIITYFALQESQYLFPRLIPPILWLVPITVGFLKEKIPLKPKLWGFIALLFITGCYNLILGLLDMASLWFVLAIIYALFLSEKNAAFHIFVASFTTILITGILMMTKNSYIPLKYNFGACEFACVAIRILHFLMIGSLVYYILGTFYREIRTNLDDLEKQSNDLESANHALEQESFEKRIAQQKTLEAVIFTEENERKRLAADLHDGLGPVLASAKLFFQAYIDADDPDSRMPIENRLKGIIDTAIQDVSRISHNISPHILEQFGFVKALETFTDNIAKSQAIRFQTEFRNIDRFDLKRELSLYRMLTELIHNTIKHAGASLITISCFAAAGLLIASYTDDGCGFSVAEEEKHKSGIGLTSLRSRIRSLGGSITISSNPSEGMFAQIKMPLVDEATQ